MSDGVIGTGGRYAPEDLGMQLSDVRHHVGDLAYSHGKGIADAQDYDECAADLRALAQALAAHSEGMR